MTVSFGSLCRRLPQGASLRAGPTAETADGRMTTSKGTSTEFNHEIYPASCPVDGSRHDTLDSEPVILYSSVKFIGVFLDERLGVFVAIQDTFPVNLFGELFNERLRKFLMSGNPHPVDLVSVPLDE